MYKEFPGWVVFELLGRPVKKSVMHCCVVCDLALVVAVFSMVVVVDTGVVATDGVVTGSLRDLSRKYLLGSAVFDILCAN